MYKNESQCLVKTQHERKMKDKSHKISRDNEENKLWFY